MQRFRAIQRALSGTTASYQSLRGQVQVLARSTRTSVAQLRRQFASQSSSGERNAPGLCENGPGSLTKVRRKVRVRNAVILCLSVSLALSDMCRGCLSPSAASTGPEGGKGRIPWVAIIVGGTGALIAYNAWYVWHGDIAPLRAPALAGAMTRPLAPLGPRFHIFSAMPDRSGRRLSPVYAPVAFPHAPCLSHPHALASV